MTIRVANEKTTVGAPAKIAEANPSIGLTSAEAERRRQTFGPNAIPDVSAHALGRALEKFWSPVPWMLEGAIALELVMGKYRRGHGHRASPRFQRRPQLFSGRSGASDACRIEIAACDHGVGSTRRDLETRPRCRACAGRCGETNAGRRWFLRTRKFNPVKFCSTNPCSRGSQRRSRRVTAPRPMRGP